MNEQLWKAIEAFDLSQKNAPNGFALRLASEQNWTLYFTESAIFEYKKFMYLAATLNDMVSPSPIIDVVWHQHLIYTESYDAFCKLLGKKVGHKPGTGISGENDSFREAFARTIEHYRKVFGKEDATIWYKKSPMEPIVWKKSVLTWSRYSPYIAIPIALVLTVICYFSAGKFYRFIGPGSFIGVFLLIGTCSLLLGYLIAKRSVYNRLRELTEKNLLRQLNVSELLYMKHSSNDYLIQCHLNEALKKGILEVDSRSRKLRLVAPHLAETREDHAISTLMNNQKELSYAAAHIQLKNSPVFHHAKHIVQNLDELYKQSVGFERAVGNFMMINSLIFALALSRIIIGIERDKSVGIIVLMLILFSFIWVYLQKKITDRIFKDAVCRLYEEQPTHNNWECGSEQFNNYYSLNKHAFTPALLLLIPTYMNFFDHSFGRSDNGSGCGSSCGSSGCSSCGGCGGCGGD